MLSYIYCIIKQDLLFAIRCVYFCFFLVLLHRTMILFSVVHKRFVLSVVFFPLKADRWPSNKCNAVEQWSPVDNHNFVIMFVRAYDTENPQVYGRVLTYMWKWRFQAPQFGSRVSVVCWRLSCLLSGLATVHRMSDLSHDVQRSINDQRSLRYRARSAYTSTKGGTRHRKSWMWYLRQEILWKIKAQVSPSKRTRYWWHSEFPVRALLTKIQW